MRRTYRPDKWEPLPSDNTVRTFTGTTIPSARKTHLILEQNNSPGEAIALPFAPKLVSVYGERWAKLYSAGNTKISVGIQNGEIIRSAALASDRDTQGRRATPERKVEKIHHYFWFYKNDLTADNIANYRNFCALNPKHKVIVWTDDVARCRKQLPEAQAIKDWKHAFDADEENPEVSMDFTTVGVTNLAKEESSPQGLAKTEVVGESALLNVAPFTAVGINDSPGTGGIAPGASASTEATAIDSETGNPNCSNLLHVKILIDLLRSSAPTLAKDLLALVVLDRYNRDQNNERVQGGSISDFDVQWIKALPEDFMVEEDIFNDGLQVLILPSGSSAASDFLRTRPAIIKEHFDITQEGQHEIWKAKDPREECGHSIFDIFQFPLSRDVNARLRLSEIYVKSDQTQSYWTQDMENWIKSNPDGVKIEKRNSSPKSKSSSHDAFPVAESTYYFYKQGASERRVIAQPPSR